MSMKSLTTEQMLAVSEPLVTDRSGKEEKKQPAPKDAGDEKQVRQPTPREILLSVDETRHVVPHLEKAHRVLLGLRPPDDRDYRKLVEETDALDARFDTTASATYDAYSVLAALTDDPEEKAELLRLQILHFPRGKDVTRMRNLEEGGAMMAAEEKMDDPSRAFLGAQKLGRQGTLLSSLESCFGLGKDLHQVELRKIAEEQRLQANTAKVTSAAARSGWIKALETLLGNLELANLTEETLDLLLGGLREAQAEADKRVVAEARRRAKAKEKKNQKPAVEKTSDDRSEKDSEDKEPSDDGEKE